MDSRSAIEGRSSALVRSARTFAALVHAGRRRRGSDTAPHIRHRLEVAELLCDAGCSDVVVAAGLLHDTIDGARVTMARLATLFGDDVANLVAAVSEDPSITTYRERKQQLREHVRNAGHDAALLFAAATIAEVTIGPARHPGRVCGSRRSSAVPGKVCPVAGRGRGYVDELLCDMFSSREECGGRSGRGAGDQQ